MGYVTRSSPPTSFPPKSLILFVVWFVCLVMQPNRCVVKNFSTIDSALYLYIDELKKIYRWMAIYTLGCHGRMTHTRWSAIIIVRLATRTGRNVVVIIIVTIRRSCKKY